jgi:hypothetical protein
MYNFSDDWQAHLNDAGLGGAWNGPGWVVDGVNSIRSWLGVPLLNNQGNGSAAAGLSRSNVQQFESDQANGTNKTGLNDSPISTSSDNSLVPLVLFGLLVMIVVNIFRK